MSRANESKIVVSQVPEDLVRDCLYNWLGYGNPNGKFWFVGFEESLNLSKCEDVETVEDYFRLRSEFDIAMDLEEVYEELLGRPLQSFRRDTAWHKIARFLLSWEGKPPDLEEIQAYVVGNEATVGREDSHNFAVETFPLIKASDSSIGRYGGIWDSVSEYHQEVLPQRVELMTDVLKRSPDVDWIYVYGLSNPCAKELLNTYPHTKLGSSPSGMNTRDPEVYQLTITETRTVRLIHGPFFKRGMTNAAIETLAAELRERFA